MPRSGYKQTEAHRAAISAAVRGKEISDESRDRMRLAHLGQTFTLETREKMAAAKRGKKQTEEAVERRMAGRRAAAERRALQPDSLPTIATETAALAQDAMPQADGIPHSETGADITQIARDTRVRAAALNYETVLPGQA